MDADEPMIDADARRVIARAIMRLRERVVWKPGKGTSHLVRRKAMGHLAPDASYEEYESLVQRVLANSLAHVYAYRYGETTYGVVLGRDSGACWLVMFGLDGVMETAFPPDDAEGYTRSKRMRLIGIVQEVVDAAFG